MRLPLPTSEASSSIDDFDCLGILHLVALRSLAHAVQTMQKPVSLLEDKVRWITCARDHVTAFMLSVVFCT